RRQAGPPGDPHHPVLEVVAGPLVGDGLVVDAAVHPLAVVVAARRWVDGVADRPVLAGQPLVSQATTPGMPESSGTTIGGGSTVTGEGATGAGGNDRDPVSR